MPWNHFVHCHKQNYSSSDDRDASLTKYLRNYGLEKIIETH